MKGDRVEAVVDTGQGTQTFDIVARRAGRRIEITTARGVVEVTEVTRSGTPVRTGRFMANRLIALVEQRVGVQAAGLGRGDLLVERGDLLGVGSHRPGGRVGQRGELAGNLGLERREPA